MKSLRDVIKQQVKNAFDEYDFDAIRVYDINDVGVSYMNGIVSMQNAWVKISVKLVTKNFCDWVLVAYYPMKQDASSKAKVIYCDSLMDKILGTA